ncbi:MAG: hypothetical protein H6592_15405 [Flavobacteriales bacterium]|nr:hypothetical protein [Flavobacteriales bacterium]
MKRIILTYGLIGGLIVSAMMWFTLGDGVHDWENGELIGYTTMVIALSTIFFGVKPIATRSWAVPSASARPSSSASTSRWWPAHSTWPLG